MECSICYENFIQPSSDENYEELKKEFMTNHNHDNDKDIKFMSLLLFPNRTPRYRCQNDKCCQCMCDYCYENTINEKELFKCHSCRVNDYKTYMKINVLRELQIKVLGDDGFRKWYKEQLYDIMGV
jgi:hypothetical protein